MSPRTSQELLLALSCEGTHRQPRAGDTATTINFAMVVTLMARLGAAHGLRGVPLAMADAVTLTQALVLEKALVTLQTDARMGEEAGEVPQTGPTSPLGAALQGWLDAVLRA